MDAWLDRWMDVSILICAFAWLHLRIGRKVLLSIVEIQLHSNLHQNLVYN